MVGGTAGGGQTVSSVVSLEETVMVGGTARWAEPSARSSVLRKCAGSGSQPRLIPRGG